MSREAIKLHLQREYHTMRNYPAILDQSKSSKDGQASDDQE